eukprot:5162376-Prymnesium_polylepis.1
MSRASASHLMWAPALPGPLPKKCATATSASALVNGLSESGSQRIARNCSRVSCPDPDGS